MCELCEGDVEWVRPEETFTTADLERYAAMAVRAVTHRGRDTHEIKVLTYEGQRIAQGIVRKPGRPDLYVIVREAN